MRTRVIPGNQRLGNRLCQVAKVTLDMELCRADAPLAPRSYVLLISGTMNPPHKGHVHIGLSAARALRARKHIVTAICYVPVHDNYLHNKVTLSTASRPAGVPASQDTLCFSYASRCAMMRELIAAEAPEEAGICHVLDYESTYGSELLADSPHYWAPKLPGGYLRTVPTTELIAHFASHSPLLSSSPGSRLAVVFGIDTLSGMGSWNGPERLLEQVR